jgi:transposase
MLDQWRALDDRIMALGEEFADMARNDPAARRLATIPGIGVLNATALLAAIGDGAHSVVGAIFRPGSGWCRARRRASRGCSGSPSAAANICAKTNPSQRQLRSVYEVLKIRVAPHAVCRP